MKKLVLATFLGLGVFVVTSLNAEKLSSEQFSQVANDCFKTRNKTTCQRLVDSGLVSVEQCDKSNCNNIGVVYGLVGDYHQSAKYYAKACNLNQAGSCNNLAILYDDG